MATRRVLVFGATGQQGGAVARALIKRGHAVRALVRDAGSRQASYLGRLGVELRAGDFAQPETIERAARGVDAVFLMLTPFEDGPEAEARRGIAAADAIAAAGVQHLVYSSVAGANAQTGIPHFDSKFRVEQHVTGLAVPATIVAPVFFMENLLAPASLVSLRSNKLTLPLPAGIPLQQLALADLGTFVALVVERCEPFVGQRIEIASDELDGSTAARFFSDFLGREVTYSALPIARVRAASEDAARMFEWFDRVGYRADIGHLRSAYPEVGWHRFDEWLRTQDRALFSTEALSDTSRRRRDLR